MPGPMGFLSSPLFLGFVAFIFMLVNFAQAWLGLPSVVDGKFNFSFSNISNKKRQTESGLVKSLN